MISPYVWKYGLNSVHCASITKKFLFVRLKSFTESQGYHIWYYDRYNIYIYICIELTVGYLWWQDRAQCKFFELLRSRQKSHLDRKLLSSSYYNDSYILYNMSIWLFSVVNIYTHNIIHCTCTHNIRTWSKRFLEISVHGVAVN